MKKIKIKKKGSALLMLFICSLPIITISHSFLKLTSNKQKHTQITKKDVKAFYNCEAGMQEALHKIKTDSNFRDNPYSFNKALNSYLIAVSVQLRNLEVDIKREKLKIALQK